jgi:hypothetical protein
MYPIASRCSKLRMWWLQCNVVALWMNISFLSMRLSEIGLAPNLSEPELSRSTLRPSCRDESMHAHIVNSTAPIFRRALSRLPGRTPWVCTSCHARSSRNRSITTQPASEKPYYITTPIFYVNAAPHVGHLYTMVLSDIIKRWQVLKCKNALLLTGTDEHGLKVYTTGDELYGIC